MRKFIITEEQRQEILRLLNVRSFLAARNALNQLEDIKDNAPRSEPDRNAGKKGEG